MELILNIPTSFNLVLGDCAARMPTDRIIAQRRRFFGNRFLLLIAEDSPERSSAIIWAVDEVNGGYGWLELSDTAIRQAYDHYIVGRAGGIAADLGLNERGRIFANSLLRDKSYSESLVPELMTRILDSVYMESNAFGSEWNLRVSTQVPYSPDDSDIGPCLSLVEGSCQSSVARKLRGDLALSRWCDCKCGNVQCSASSRPSTPRGAVRQCQIGCHVALGNIACVHCKNQVPVWLSRPTAANSAHYQVSRSNSRQKFSCAVAPPSRLRRPFPGRRPQSAGSLCRISRRSNW